MMSVEDITDILSYKKNDIEYKITCEGKGYYEGCKIGGYRYKLEIIIEPKNPKGEKTLACIMMNPSKTFPNVGFDKTVSNVIKMAHSKGYSKVCIFNLFPYIQPKGPYAIKHFDEKEDINQKYIDEWLDKKEICNELLVAWGNSLPKGRENKNKYINRQKKYLETFKNCGIDPVCYAWNTKKECPYHPSQQVNNRFTKKEGEIVARKKNDGSKGLIQQFIDDEKAKFENYPKQ